MDGLLIAKFLDFMTPMLSKGGFAMRETGDDPVY